MYWFKLCRNPWAKSHGSWRWHVGEVSPTLSSSLLPHPFFRGKVGSETVGLPLTPSQHSHAKPWAKGNGPLQNLQSSWGTLLFNFLYSGLTSNLPPWDLIPCALRVLQGGLGHCFLCWRWEEMELYLYLILYYFHVYMEIDVVIVAWIIYLNTSFLWKLQGCPVKRQWFKRQYLSFATAKSQKLSTVVSVFYSCSKGPRRRVCEQKMRKEREN